MTEWPYSLSDGTLVQRLREIAARPTMYDATPVRDVCREAADALEAIERTVAARVKGRVGQAV
jgi:hypothetical protein